MNPADKSTAPDIPGDSRLVEAGVRRLTPDVVTLFEGVSSMIHCSIQGEGLYRGVFAVRMFPVRHADRYISLHYTDVNDREQDLGVIEDPGVFPKEQQELIFRDLRAHYYEQTIRRIYDARCEYGVLFFDVETQRGREEFVMPWRGDRAEDYGESGKVLLDALDNRYIIPSIPDLPPADRRRFSNYIYW
jgi:hypothetical protein